MKSQTILSFDFGRKHIGVAVGQTITRTATPLNSLRAKAGEPEWEKIQQLIDYWRPSVLMVGMPFSLDGSEQSMTYAARRFIKELQQRYGLPVHMVDERFTTQEAKQQLFAKGGLRALEKTRVDSWAAKIILESGLKDWN